MKLSEEFDDICTKKILDLQKKAKKLKLKSDDAILSWHEFCNFCVLIKAKIEFFEDNI